MTATHWKSALVVVSLIFIWQGAAGTTIATAQTNSTLVVEKGNPDNFDSIENAVDNATDGDTVEVRPGTYREGDIFIDKNITLTAPDGATLNGSENQPGSTITFLDAIVIAGSAVPTIDGFTITGYTDHGVDARASSGAWTIRNTTITNNLLAGVDTDRTEGAWTIQNSTIIGNGQSPDSADPGVTAFRSSGDWTIRNTTFSNNTGGGIQAEVTDGNWTIRDTTFTNQGVDADDSTGDWTILDSTFTGGGVNALRSEGNWTIRDTTITDSSEPFVGVAAQDSTGDWVIRNTTLKDRGGGGVSADGSTGDWRIRNTTVTNSSGDNADGISAGGSTGDWRIRDTTITDSGDDGIESRSSSGNWRLRDTDITNSGDTGVEASNSDGNWRIRDTTITDNGDMGVNAEASEGAWRIRNTTIANSDGSGVDAADSTGDWTIQNATITNGASAGIVARGTSGAWAVHQSNITNNTQTDEVAASGIDATEAEIQGNATQNWWGDASGPDDNDCAGNVDCSNWLTGQDGNQPPVADAGDDQTVDENTQVTLDGTGSSDPDGDELSFAWEQVDGPAVDVEDADTATPTFTAPAVETDTELTFELTVSDGNASDSDRVGIVVQANETQGGFDVARQLGSETVVPGGTAQVTVTANVTNERATVNETFAPGFASASIASVQVNGTDASPTLQQASSEQVLVTLSELSPPARIEVTYTVTISEETDPGTTFVFEGRVTAGETTPLGTDQLAVVEQKGPVERFDENNDGSISLPELTNAAAAFARGEVDLPELTEVATAFARG